MKTNYFSVYVSEEDKDTVEKAFKVLEDISGIKIKRIYKGRRETRENFLMDFLKEIDREGDEFEIYVVDTKFVELEIDSKFGITFRKIASDGSFLRERGRIIISSKLVKEKNDDHEKALFYVTLHELGHFHGLPPHSTKFIYQGKNAWHCAEKGCIMRNIDNEEIMKDLMSKNSYFCERCERALKENVRKLYE